MHAQAWQLMKDTIAGAVVRAVYHPNLHTVIMTDASDRFWSICITQVPQEDRFKPVSEMRHVPIVFNSGSFTHSEFR